MGGSQIMSQIALHWTRTACSYYCVLILSFVLITTTTCSESTAVLLDPNHNVGHYLKQPAESNDVISHRVKRQQSSGGGSGNSDIWNTNSVYRQTSFSSSDDFDRRREQTQREFDESFADHEKQMKVVGTIFTVVFVAIFAIIVISILACVCVPTCFLAKKIASHGNGRGAVYSGATVVPPPTSGPGNYPTQPYITGIALPPPAGSYPMQHQQPLMGGGGGGFLPPNSYSPYPPQHSPMQQQLAYNPYSPSQPVAPYYPPSSGQGPPPYPVN